jgi:hypothetical protein
VEDIRPDVLLGPAHQAIVERLARTIDGFSLVENRTSPLAAKYFRRFLGEWHIGCHLVQFDSNTVKFEDNTGDGSI